MTQAADIIERARIGRALLLFLVLLALLSIGPSYLLIAVKENSHYYRVLLMWMPALAAIITLAVLRVRLVSLGVKLVSWRTLLANYLLPFVYGLPAYIIIWLYFSGGYGGEKQIASFAAWLGLGGLPPQAVMALSVFLMLTVGVISQLSATLGEEIGWRGFLTPLLMRRVGFLGAALGTALVWALWHYALIVHGHYNNGYGQLGAQFLHYSLMLFGLSLIMTYYRVKTGSLWPAVLLHAAHNMIIIGVLDELTAKTSQSWKYAGEFGFFVPLTTLLVGIVFYLRARSEGLTAKPAI